MHIVVFTRSTPDTAAKVEVGGDGGVTWGDAATVVNPWDEYALEEAIARAKESKGNASVVAIGPEMHNDALKHSLAMGMSEAFRIEDPAIDPADGLSYAKAAAAAVEKMGDVDLVIAGKESVDVGTDQHVYMTARKLGWTMLSNVSAILEMDTDAKTIKVERTVEQGKEITTATLPAVISVLKDINEPRYPSFIGIRKAGKAKIPVWSLADLGIDAPAPKVTAKGFKALPAREISTEIIEGEPAEQAAKLVEKLLEEKVL